MRNYRLLFHRNISIQCIKTRYPFCIGSVDTVECFGYSVYVEKYNKIDMNPSSFTLLNNSALLKCNGETLFTNILNTHIYICVWMRMHMPIWFVVGYFDVWNPLDRQLSKPAKTTIIFTCTHRILHRLIAIYVLKWLST